MKSRRWNDFFWHAHQWNFFKGWQNNFDLLRIGLEWVRYDKARLCLVLMGLVLEIVFPARNINELRRLFLEWWRCPECGKRFGRHDERVAHLPF